MKQDPFLTRLGQTLLSLAKIILKSRRPSLSPLTPPPERPLLVMGNGPSLRVTLDRDGALLQEADLMAVNFAANTPEFLRLKPRWYVLADPHFFSGAATDPNVAALMEHLRHDVSWPMTLLVPATHARFTTGNPLITVSTFNFIGAEGFARFERKAYASGRAMPRPRNVLIPAIMCGIRLGYKRILIAGADHSWTRTLDVTADNRVCSVQPHFYADNDEEHRRVAQVYTDICLHEILLSFHIAFRAYHRIAAFAQWAGVEVLNVTPGSFIDAFPRLDLSTLTSLASPSGKPAPRP